MKIKLIKELTTAEIKGAILLASNKMSNKSKLIKALVTELLLRK